MHSTIDDIALMNIGQIRIISRFCAVSKLKVLYFSSALRMFFNFGYFQVSPSFEKGSYKKRCSSSST